MLVTQDNSFENHNIKRIHWKFKSNITGQSREEMPLKYDARVPSKEEQGVINATNCLFLLFAAVNLVRYAISIYSYTVMDEMKELFLTNNNFS